MSHPGRPQLVRRWNERASCFGQLEGTNDASAGVRLDSCCCRRIDAPKVLKGRGWIRVVEFLERGPSFSGYGGGDPELGQSRSEVETRSSCNDCTAATSDQLVDRFVCERGELADGHLFRE